MNVKTRTFALATAGVLALGGVAACGSSSSGGSPAAAPTPSAANSPVASIPSLTGVHTQVTLDSGFLSALTKLKVTPGTTGTATLSGATLTFPITGGNVTYYKPGTHSPYVIGNILHNGSGITLTAGGIKVGLSNFDVNPGTSMLTGKVTANGKTVLASAPLFFLNGKTLQPLQVDSSNSTAVLQGTKVYLTSAAAQLLDKTYKLPSGTLSSSTLVGVAKITVKVPSS